MGSQSLGDEAENCDAGGAGLCCSDSASISLIEGLEDRLTHRTWNSRQFEAHRRRAFPAPFPNGWYHLLNTNELSAGKIVSISALGRDFVAFRTSSGEVGVLDAYCPHLGAHLGSGTLTAQGLACPFHGWKFDANGKCLEIPYMPDGSEVPAMAKTKAWEVVERDGMIFIW